MGFTLHHCSVVILALACASLGLSATAAECPDSFRALLFQDKPNIGSPAMVRGFEGEETRMLGSGEMGGHVYLVKPRDQTPPFVVKIYDLGGPGIARNDRIAFSILNGVLNSEAKPGTLRSIDSVEQLNPSTLKLQWVSGRDIEQVSWTAGADRERLSRLFLRQLQEAKRKLDKAGSFSVDGNTYRIKSSILQPRGFEGKAKLEMVLENLDPEAKPTRIRIILKSDGVVLTPDGQFVVIDPS
jgi:hypothetical protein